MQNMKHRNQSKNKMGWWRSNLNTLKLYIAMSIAWFLSSPESLFSQTNWGTANEIWKTINISNKISVSDYQMLVKERDDYINNNWDDSYMDPNKYFVLNQKSMFNKAMSINRDWARSKLNEIEIILKNKFNKTVTNNPIENVKLALQVIATEGGHKDFASLVSNLTGTIDINMVNACGYIQINTPWIKKTSYGGMKMPRIELSAETLDRILFLLTEWKYYSSFDEAKKDLDKKNEPVNDSPNNNKNINTDWGLTEDEVEALLWGWGTEDEKEVIDVQGSIEEKNVAKNKWKIEEKSENITSKIQKNETKKAKKITDEKRISNESSDWGITKSEIEALLWGWSTEEESIDWKTAKVKTEVVEEKKNEDAQKIIKKTAEIENSNELTELEYFEKQRNNDLVKIWIEWSREDYISHTKNNLKKIGAINVDDKLIVGLLTLIDEYWISVKRWNDSYTFGQYVIREIDYTKSLETLEVTDENVRNIESIKKAVILIKKYIPQENIKEKGFNKIDIINTMSWNAEILSKKLYKSKLDKVSYEELIETVNWFNSKELQKAFMMALLNNDVVYAQELMWMKLWCSTHYPNYTAATRIWQEELKKMKKLGKVRQYMQEDEIMNNGYIPQDIKDVYQNFINWIFDNKWLSYNILSKTDMKLYMFSEWNILLERQNSLIWKHVWDQKNSPPNSKTTPGGMYQIGEKFRNDMSGKSFYDKYGTHYIVLIPLEWQYNISKRYTMWVHWVFLKELTTRTNAINSSDRNSHLESSGCVNLIPEKFGGVYNQFVLWSMLFVTYEPDSNAIQQFTEQTK